MSPNIENDNFKGISKKIITKKKKRQKACDGLLESLQLTVQNRMIGKLLMLYYDCTDYNFHSLLDSQGLEIFLSIPYTSY
jgi:hypothetical protein